MRRDRERLRDILDAIEHIERYAARGEETFFQDELVQVWIIHHIQVLGEAANNLSETLHEHHPEIPWADVVAMRNVLIHHYFGIDLRQVWNTVEIHVPELRQRIEAMLHEEPEEDGEISPGP